MSVENHVLSSFFNSASLNKKQYGRINLFYEKFKAVVIQLITALFSN